MGSNELKSISLEELLKWEQNTIGLTVFFLQEQPVKKVHRVKPLNLSSIVGPNV